MQSQYWKVSFSSESNGGNLQNHYSSIANGFCGFVVHVHESRLSINEDNAGIGYSKFYRALLGATGEYNKKSVSLEKKIYLTLKNW